MRYSALEGACRERAPSAARLSARRSCSALPPADHRSSARFERFAERSERYHLLTSRPAPRSVEGATMPARPLGGQCQRARSSCDYAVPDSRSSGVTVAGNSPGFPAGGGGHKLSSGRGRGAESPSASRVNSDPGSSLRNSSRSFTRPLRRLQRSHKPAGVSQLDPRGDAVQDARLNGEGWRGTRRGFPACGGLARGCLSSPASGGLASLRPRSLRHPAEDWESTMHPPGTVHPPPGS